jgi:hypothetical protein
MPSDYAAISKHNEQQLGLDTASRRTQISMYSDSTHFIYEILQNADDYGATEIVFTLSRHALSIKHNGTPFNTRNVKAITYFGKGTSSEDLVKTGHFGVGFKSVFAFTASPSIHSGEENFQIYGLYRVRPADKPEDFRRTHTIITLPFNHEEEQPDYVEDHVSASESYKKIAERLTGLNMNTLLFTRNIREIRWQTATRSGHYLREDNVKDGCRWSSITDGNALRKYLVFSRVPTWRDQEHKPVEVAFGIDDKNMLTAIDDYLHVLFATTQETHLQFILNGPYRTTPSRESIAEDDQFNVHLLKETCALLKELLPQLRERGLLSVQALAVFPNPNDNLRDFYESVRLAIVHSFKSEELVPTDGNGFAVAAHVCHGPARIREVIAPEDLAFLSRRETAVWAKGVQQNSRADHFLRSLDIEQWGWDALQESLDDMYGGFSYYGSSAIDPDDDEWLSTRSDSWMQKLYLLLGEAIKKEDCSAWTLERCRVVRVQESGNECHVSGAKAYFPKGRGNRELPQVKPTILRVKNPKTTERIEESLVSLGVSKIGDGERIDVLLETSYGEGSTSVTKQQSLQHMGLFIKWWKKENNATKFADYRIFYSSKSESMHKAAECYLDAPLRKSGLDMVYADKRCTLASKAKLWTGYRKVPGDGFCDFAVACGVIDCLEIEEQSCYNHPNERHLRQDFNTWGVRFVAHTGINDDYIIEGLPDLLAMRKREVNHLLWRTVCKADPEKLEASYRPNRQYPTRNDKSSLVVQLSRAEWIPDKRGRLHKPCAITKAQLHPTFKYDNRNGWLDEIGFAEEAKEADAEYQKRKSMAASLGVPMEVTDYLSKIPDSERDQEVKDLTAYVKRKQASRKRIARIQKKDTPFHTALAHAFDAPGTSSDSGGSSTASPNATDRRRTRVAGAIEDALEGEPSPDTRFFLGVCKKWKGKNDAVRVALKEWYGGRCQICRRTFLQPNGQPYFEGLYLVPYTRNQWIDRVGNVICVCPWHSAMFQFGVKEVEEDILQQIMALQTVAGGGSGKSHIKMRLSGDLVEIQFTEKHFVDLQEMIKASQKSTKTIPSESD